MTVPSLEENHGLDTSDRGSGLNYTAASDIDGEQADQESPSVVEDAWLLQRIQQARGQAVAFTTTTVRSQWARNYKAYRNEHFEGSKYNSPEFRGRSKLFRPKTRAAVRKSLKTAATALFSTGDVVSIKAQNESDDFQVASASIKQELINYRLSRTSRRNGIRWFMTALGARQDSLITGICASKQEWLYKERLIKAGTPDAIDEDGNVVPGEPDQIKVLVDRPSISLYAPENVLFDPNCDFTDPVDTSEYMILRNPMTPGEAARYTTARPNSRTLIPWREGLTEDFFARYVSPTGPSDSQATRAGRAGGRDPVQQTAGVFAPVWLEEVFIKIDNDDWVLWTINGTEILSDPILVDEAYPWAGGDRPVVIGYGSIEAHRAYPTSEVESWQPMQQEINDQVNLRLDHMKQAVTPPAKVRRGRKVDLNQVQRRGPNSLIMLDNMEDVEWAEIPDLPQSAFIENNSLNADFDDLTGGFSPGTVQTNRQMNETVGGLSLLSASADGIADFDLAVWVETWVEPVLWQLLKLEEHYESDANVLAIAGQKAQLYEKFGINHITDQLLMAETTMQVKVGVGASNLPMAKLQKFTMASQTTQAVLAPFVQSGIVQIVPNAEEIVNTIYGLAGFQDGGQRFFSVISNGQPGQNPQAMAMQAHTQLAQSEQQVKMAQIQAGMHKAQLDNQTKQQQIAASLHDNAADRYAEIYAAHQKSLGEIGKAIIDQQHEAAVQGRDHAHAHALNQRSLMRDVLHSVLSGPGMGPQGAPAAPANAQPPKLQGFQPLPQMNSLGGQGDWASLTSLSKRALPKGAVQPGAIP